MHLDDQALRAYLDGQLAEPEAATAHIASCARCRGRLEAIQARAQRVSAHMAALDPTPVDAARPVQQAFAQFTARRKAAERKEQFPMFGHLFSQRTRPLWIGLSAVVVLAVALSFQPVRVWAGNLLGAFRVQTVVVLPVDNTRLSALGTDTALGKQLSQLLSDSSRVTKEPGKPQQVADKTGASQSAGFGVRLPTSQSDAPQITVQGAGAFEFTANRARAQGLLDEAGFKDVKLPASLDGALIKIEIPAAVTAGYGQCPKLLEQVAQAKQQMLEKGVQGQAGSRQVAGSPDRTMRDCIILSQMTSPSVSAPPDLDLNQLAEIGLQFTGMTAEQAHAYSKNVDWTSTLVVPIPRNGASYKQVQVDGVTGNLIERPRDDAPQYALVWVKDGVIYAIGGLGADTSAALAMANSMK